MIPALFATFVTVRQPKSVLLPATRCRFGPTRKAALIRPGLAAIALLVLAPGWHPARVLAQSTSFQVLGPMPGSLDGGFTYASGISADGSTIVGGAYVALNSAKTEAFRWTVDGGYDLLGDLGGYYGSTAYATSPDGSIVVGDAPQGSNIFGAFRWTAAEGMQPVPGPIVLRGYAVSADGASIVGGSAYFNISGQSGEFTPPVEQKQTTALGLSADGQIAVGFSINGSNGTGPTYNAFRWTLDTGLQIIGVAGVNSDARAISADGSVAVGEFQIQVNGPYHASRWTADGAMLDLGTLGGGLSAANATNSDGSVVAGGSLSTQPTASNHAFRWTALTGMQDLNELVGTGNCAAHPWPADCFVLISAAGVSADGTVITGTTWAPSPDSTFPVQVPFRAVVPLP